MTHGKSKCDTNGWIIMDALAEAWNSRQGDGRLFNLKCALMEELYSYQKKQTINGYVPRRPYYPKGAQVYQHVPPKPTQSNAMSNAPARPPTPIVP